MRYLPILQELLESDTVLFLLAGVVIGLVAGVPFRSRKKSLVGAAVSLAIYVVCEIASNLRGSYLTQIIVLFVGTAAIGGTVGFLASLLWGRLVQRSR